MFSVFNAITPSVSPVSSTFITTSRTQLLNRGILTRFVTLSRIMARPASPGDNSSFLLSLKNASTKLAPHLDVKGNYKGASGKIGVIGGSFEYTGAPYFAAITALKTGADLVHVFCSRDAAIPIKCYSPELIVHPVLQPEDLDEVTYWLKHMDVILIGCGMGRKMETLTMATKIITHVKMLKKPLILDADALFLMVQHPTLLNGFESPVMLTPNRMELARLVGVTNPVALNDDDILLTIKKNNWNENITLLVKSVNDQVYNKHKKVTLVDFGGSGRRCGGQGDILGGCLAVFLNWSIQKNVENPTFVAAYAACMLTRTCNQRAFLTTGRSMTAGDMIEHIHSAFASNFEQQN